MKLGRLLWAARQSKKITLRQLEKETGISNGLISQIETGYVLHPSFRRVVLIARALGLNLEELAKATMEE